MADDRSAVIKIGDTEYELLLTTKATKEIAKKYGGLSNLGDKLINSENYEEAISEIVWLIVTLANQPILIYNFKNKDKKKELLTEDEVELLTTPNDLATYKDAILAFLWLIEFANKRSTNIINGYSSYNQTTGGTDSIEIPTGYLTANNRMKYRGIEDFIGNDAVWMPDVTGAYYTSRDVETYKNGATNKTQLSYYMNITVSSSWRGIQALGWDDNNPFICLPSKLGSSSSTTYFGTNMYGPNGSNEYLSRNKIYSGYSSNCNLLSPVFDYQFSNASSTTTSRLIKYEI